MIGGAILDLIAFPKNAPYGAVPDDVIWNLGLFVGPATSIFSAAGIGLFRSIDWIARHAEIAPSLEERQDCCDQSHHTEWYVEKTLPPLDMIKKNPGHKIKRLT